MPPYESVEGYWSIENTAYSSKFQALVDASKLEKNVQYHFFDSIWESFDRTAINKFTLKNLYAIRAQQLRDEYDYLIVYFSGGADSYNVIRSFVDNGIKLDEVCVKWPMSTIKAGVYTPDPNNDSPSNTLSEWDYAIKPKLDWLSRAHPEVKITIVDWSENFNEDSYSLNLFTAVNNFNDVEIPFMMAYSENEQKLLDQGKKVASIYGIEKPKLGCVNGKWFMRFMDQATAMGTPSTINPTGTEYFYWTPKFPVLAFQQAYELCQYLDKTPDLKKYFPGPHARDWDIPARSFAKRMQNSVSRSVLYDTWDNAFQAFKPDVPDRADKHFWIFEHPELTRIRDAFIDVNSLFLSQIHPRFNLLVLPEQNNFDKPRGIYKGLFTKWHFVKFEETDGLV